MREIPPLRVLCLRSIGATLCNPEVTFGTVVGNDAIDNANVKKEEEDVPNLEKEEGGGDDDKKDDRRNNDATKKEEEGGGGEIEKKKEKDDGTFKKENVKEEDKDKSRKKDGKSETTKKKKMELTSASKLLRSFHKRPTLLPPGTTTAPSSPTNNKDDDGKYVIHAIPFHRQAYIGHTIIISHHHPHKPNSTIKTTQRRNNANDVDLNHPWIASIYPPRAEDDYNNSNSNKPVNMMKEMLCIENGNVALDVLQSIIDSLVDLGRMDDLRLGRKFFEEWTFAAASAAAAVGLADTKEGEETTKKKEEEQLQEEKDEMDVVPRTRKDKDLQVHDEETATLDERKGKQDYAEAYHEQQQEYDVINNYEETRYSSSSKKKKKKDKKKKKKKDKKSSSSSSSSSKKRKHLELKNDSNYNYSNHSLDNNPKKSEKKINKHFSSQTRRSSSKGAALSLHNCASLSTQTFTAMVQANIGSIITTLDLTGVHSLTDDIFVSTIVSHCKLLERLSLKNCRKVTGLSLKAIVMGLPKLRAIDVGGSFNIHPNDIIHLVKHHPNTKTHLFDEIYASGLGWTDATLSKLLSFCNTHLRGLSIGFSPLLSSLKVVDMLSSCGDTLERVGLHFVDCVDNGVLESLGRMLKHLCVLDIRGCGGVSSLNGMMESRFDYGSVIQTGDNGGGGGSSGEKRRKKKKRRLEEKQHDEHEEYGDHDNEYMDGGGEERDWFYQRHLFVLARYSGITKKSLEETRRIHSHVLQQRQMLGGSEKMSSLELPLTCILDGEGTGGGIRR